MKRQGDICKYGLITVRRKLRGCIGASLIALLLTACATAPPSRRAEKLFVCPGGGVSNAPVTNSAQEVVGFTPSTQLRGRVLLRAPANGCVSSGFGPRRGGAGSFHEGVDLFTRRPAPIVAAGAGIIIEARSMRGYGKTITIDHGRGVKTRYAHLSRFASGMRAGRQVSLGDYLGDTGRTGNATAVHLHYEVLVDSRPVNILNLNK